MDLPVNHSLVAHTLPQPPVLGNGKHTSTEGPQTNSHKAIQKWLEGGERTSAKTPPPHTQCLEMRQIQGDCCCCCCQVPSVVSNSLRPHGLYSPWNSPYQNTGVDSLSLLQGIFPTQGSNTGLLQCRQILYQLNHQVGM